MESEMENSEEERVVASLQKYSMELFRQAFREAGELYRNGDVQGAYKYLSSKMGKIALEEERERGRQIVPIGIRGGKCVIPSDTEIVVGENVTIRRLGKPEVFGVEEVDNFALITED